MENAADIHYVVKNVHTLEYLSKEGGVWTYQTHAALLFDTPREALEWCHRHKVQEFRLDVIFVWQAQPAP
jgi:hypothetical protein